MSSALPSILQNKRQSVADQGQHHTLQASIKKNREQSAKSTKKVEILSERRPRNSKSRTKQLSPQQLIDQKNKKYLQSLNPGQGGNPMSAHLRQSRVSIGSVEPPQDPRKLFSPGPKRKPPINSVKKKEYEMQQQLLLAIHEQEKISYMKKMRAIEVRKEREAKKQQEMKEAVQKRVKDNREKVEKFQKKYAVAKAAEVIQLFERMAEKDPKINVKKLRKNVLNNLVDRNRDKNEDQEYWSMQLLIKLGLIPDPEADSEDMNLNLNMSAEEREQKLKEVGLYIPRQNIEELNKEMARIALENYNKMMEESIKKFSKDEIITLKKLGLTKEQIAQLDPDEIPFKDTGLAGREDLTSLISAQQQFYNELQEEYKKAIAQMSPMDLEVQRIAEKKEGDVTSEATPGLRGVDVFDPPNDFKYWSKKKQLEFQRKKMLKLQDFFKSQRAEMAQYPKMDRFLKAYSEGELNIFSNMLEQMISSTNAEIYRQAKLKKDDPNASEESDLSDDEVEVETNQNDSKLTDFDEHGDKKKKKLKPSGVIYQTHIDPDASSEEDPFVGKSTMSRHNSKIDVLAYKEKKRAAEEAAARKKERDKKLKEINKNFNRRDKRETHRFLKKHGLTDDEAKQYTQLGTNFDLKNLSESDKAILDQNFQAQVYAFRKLRDRLLLTDNPANIYDIKQIGIKSPNPTIEQKNKLMIGQQKFREQSIDGKKQLIVSVQKELTQEQIRAIRRREYYNRRVKANFAPKPLDQQTESDSDENTNSPSPSPRLSPTEKEKKLRKKQLMIERLKKKKENQPEWNMFGQEKPKKQYIKQSDRSVQINDSIRFKMRSRSTVHRSGYPQLGRLRYGDQAQSIDVAEEIRLQLPSIATRRGNPIINSQVQYASPIVGHNVQTSKAYDKPSFNGLTNVTTADVTRGQSLNFE